MPFTESHIKDIYHKTLSCLLQEMLSMFCSIPQFLLSIIMTNVCTKAGFLIIKALFFSYYSFLKNKMKGLNLIDRIETFVVTASSWETSLGAFFINSFLLIAFRFVRSSSLLAFAKASIINKVWWGWSSEILAISCQEKQ